MARPKGSKNIDHAFEEIYKKLQTAINVGTRKGLEKFAQPLVDEYAKYEPKFNDYSKGLVNSYAATVFASRRPVKTVYHKENIPAIQYGKNGARWVPLTTERHGQTRTIEETITRTYTLPWGGTREAKVKVRKRVDKKSARRRYLKSWEKLGGYRGKRFRDSEGVSTVERNGPGRSVTGFSGRRALRYNAGYFTGNGRSAAQNWIVLENKAPYADWVQRGIYNPFSHRKNRKYRVMMGAITEKVNSKGTELVRMVTKKELKQAGFKVT